MATITYIDISENEYVVDVENGSSVMEGAIANDVPGIDAECGGACACATCHVYVDPAWLSKVGEPASAETDIASFVTGYEPNSRLSCQIKVSDELEGLVVRLPESQT